MVTPHTGPTTKTNAGNLGLFCIMKSSSALVNIGMGNLMDWQECSSTREASMMVYFRMVEPMGLELGIKQIAKGLLLANFANKWHTVAIYEKIIM